MSSSPAAPGALMRYRARLLVAVGLVVAGCADTTVGDSTVGDSATTSVAATSSTTPPTTMTTTTVPTTTTLTPTITPTITTVAPTATTAAPTTTTVPLTTTTVPPTITTVAPTTTTVPPTTVPAAPALPPIAPIDALAFPTDVEVEIGRSVEGRPITVTRRGTPGGTRVLAVGVIHGNEDAGVAVIDQLAVAPVPEGVELWLVRSMNPDGQARQDRQNANAVDLNRNFPQNWDVLGEPGFWQYGGSAPASEPETRAMVALGESVRPEVILWYHQDLFRIAPGSGRSGEIRTRYAEIAGLPIVDITGGTYTGTAAQWARTVIPESGVGITVELGPTLSEGEIASHVGAVFAIATEFF